MKKILYVFGTRPEAIKMAPIIKEMDKFPEKFEFNVCVTAQHRAMLDGVLDLFNITPDYDLDIMKRNQTLTDVTCNVLIGFRSVLQDYNPDIVLVHGDTTTAMSASIAAYYERIKVAHIEAGLRTRNIYSPWPEEVNRSIVDLVSHYHFCPTNQSKDNLINDGINDTNIVVTGNTVVDSLNYILQVIDKDIDIQKTIEMQLPFINNRMILVTGHRRENFGQGLENICNAIKKISQTYCEIDIVFSVHPNPNVSAHVEKILGNVARVHLIEPQGYLNFVFLMKNAYIILTDSGGIQEEAASLGRPTLVMRDTTERPEAMGSGNAKLVGKDSELIFTEVSRLLTNESLYKSMCNAKNPYGDGDSSCKIVKFLMKQI